MADICKILIRELLMIIRKMKHEDLENTSIIHQQVFTRQRASLQWLSCNFNAFPRFLIYVAEFEGELLGYIIWAQKSGFRPEAIVDLEQIAVMPKAQGKGLGGKLIRESLAMLREQLIKQNSVLKHVTVSTRADNLAQRLYKKELGAKVEATISNLYSADEVFMIARNV